MLSEETPLITSSLSGKPGHTICIPIVVKALLLSFLYPAELMPFRNSLESLPRISHNTRPEIPYASLHASLQLALRLDRY